MEKAGLFECVAWRIRLLVGVLLGLVLVAGCGPISLTGDATPASPSPATTIQPPPAVSATPKISAAPATPPAAKPSAAPTANSPGLAPIAVPTKASSKAGRTVTVNIGDVARLKDLNFQVENINTAPGPDSNPPKTGYVYMLIFATVHNTGQDTFYIYPKTMIKLVDGVNNVYERNSYAEVGAQLLDSQTQVLAGSINPGDVVTGVLGYEVPAKDPGMVFIYTPNPGESIVVTLGDAPARFDGTRAPVPTRVPVN